MSKGALVARIRKQLPEFGAPFVGSMVDQVFDAISLELADDRPVRIPGFGTFRRKFRDTRAARNPKTGEKVTVAAHHVITFKAEKSRK